MSTYPLTTTEMATQFLLGRVTTSVMDAFTIYHDEDGVTSATVQVTATAVDLVTNLGTDSFDITTAAYDTLTELVTGINALGATGWVAELLGPAAAASTDLELTGAINTFGTSNMQYMQISADWIIDELVDQVSDMVESYLDNNILSRSYVEYFDGGHSEYALAYKPVTAISRVAQGHLGVFTVTGSSDFSRANVNITTTTLTLTSVTAGVTTTTNFTLASYATLTLLAVAIETTSGWTTDINSSYESYPAADLVPLVRRDATNSSYAYLSIWEEDAPIDNIEDDTGIVHLQSVAPQGYHTLRVSYTAGYASTPPDLEQVVLELISESWDRLGRNLSEISAKLADVSWTAKTVMIDTDKKRRLAPYRAQLF